MTSKPNIVDLSESFLPKSHWKIGEVIVPLEKRASVMGILNVTPDSFSDGGRWLGEEAALKRAEEMISEGADIIDVGGESTRPGSEAVSLEDELARVIPVIQALAKRWDGIVSVDTSKAEVARAALAVGATLINDITGLRDPAMIEVCAASHCGIVVMHMKGTPKTMQEAPVYRDVVSEVAAFFQERLETLGEAGIANERLCWDPGIGFGKRLEDNLALLSSVQELQVGSRPVMMGLSRKSFLAKLLDENEIEKRDAPTIALTARTRQLGAMVHRVHDVRGNREALRMVEAISSPDEVRV